MPRIEAIRYSSFVDLSRRESSSSRSVEEFEEVLSLATPPPPLSPLPQIGTEEEEEVEKGEESDWWMDLKTKGSDENPGCICCKTSQSKYD